MSALDPLLFEIGDGVIGPGWLELATAVGAASVVVGFVLAKDGPQVLLAKDQYPISDLCPDGEDEAFRVGARAGASGGGS